LLTSLLDLQYTELALERGLLGCALTRAFVSADIWLVVNNSSAGATTAAATQPKPPRAKFGSSEGWGFVVVELELELEPRGFSGVIHCQDCSVRWAGRQVSVAQALSD
jgi:hypothetical protein